MQIIRSVASMRQLLKDKASKSIGFVPTMGALHLGHISLINQAKSNNDIVVVSIFINPAQFGKNEDLSTYPKKEQADIESCKRANCDILFLPETKDMYARDDESYIKAPCIKGHILEGSFRGNHFDGVMTILTKLFNIISPTKAYFGKKDAQQLVLVKRLVEDLYFDIEIVACESVREKDGLVLSSRNIYLNQTTRKKALKISKALEIGYKQIQQGHISKKHIVEKMSKELDGETIDYIEITDRNLSSIEEVGINHTLILIATNIENKRYIDNLWV